jgi:hypothetical protein
LVSEALSARLKGVPPVKVRGNIKVKGVGQECPTHTGNGKRQRLGLA